jgi:hypothetical protein
MEQIHLTGEEARERAALLREVVADRPGQPATAACCPCLTIMVKIAKMGIRYVASEWPHIAQEEGSIGY